MSCVRYEECLKKCWGLLGGTEGSAWPKSGAVRLVCTTSRAESKPGPNQSCGCGCGERDSSVSQLGELLWCSAHRSNSKPEKEKKKYASKAWLRRHAENFSHSSDFSRSPVANTLLLPLLCSKPLSTSQSSGFSSAARPCRCGGHGLPPAGRPPHGAPRPSRRIGFVPPSGGAAILPRPGRGAAPGSQI